GPPSLYFRHESRQPFIFAPSEHRNSRHEPPQTSCGALLRRMAPKSEINRIRYKHAAYTDISCPVSALTPPYETKSISRPQALFLEPLVEVGDVFAIAVEQL